MQNKNVLELCLSPDLGGLELYMVRSAQALHPNMNVISVINEKGKLEQYYKDTEFKYKTLKRGRGFATYKTAKKLARIIDENDVEVIHAHWTKDLLVAVLAKQFSQYKPKIVQTRNMTMTRFKNDMYHRWLYKNISLMLPVTYQVKEQLEKFIPKDIRPKVEVLYMGSDIPETIDEIEKEKFRKQYALDNVFTVGIVGRIEKGKGQYLVIEAVKKLLDENMNLQALIVGHAMQEEYLETLKADIQNDRIQDKIIFTGFTREAQKLMQICDCLVLATDRETFGLVLIEAMASGVAVIGSDSGGPLEIIDNEESGLLFKTNDSTDLAEKIKMMMNKELKEKLSHAGKIKVDKMFESKKQFEKLYEILESL